MSDQFHYREKDYTDGWITEGKLFNISDFGMKPQWSCTACYRGYVAIFGVSESRLVLKDLHLCLYEPGAHERRSYERVAGPIINGVTPSPRVEPSDTSYSGYASMFNNNYEELNYPLDYSGGILLGGGDNDFAYSPVLYGSRYHRALGFESALELFFDAGYLKEEVDQSGRIAEVRELAEKSQIRDEDGKLQWPEEIAPIVYKPFERNYGTPILNHGG